MTTNTSTPVPGKCAAKITVRREATPEEMAKGEPAFLYVTQPCGIECVRTCGRHGCKAALCSEHFTECEADPVSREYHGCKPGPDECAGCYGDLSEPSSEAAECAVCNEEFCDMCRDGHADQCDRWIGRAYPKVVKS